MAPEPPRPLLRPALVAFPDNYSLPSRPPGVSPSAADAYRQTQFLLGEDLVIFEKAMILQLGIVAANSKLRTPAAAALFAFWSRVFSHLSDACTILACGSYASCPPLLRGACDCLATERALVRDGFGDYEAWLADAVSQDREHSALAFDLGRFRAASVLAEEARLGLMYRLLTDLSMPHFGSTALLVAPDSGLRKLSLAFADTAFHLAWAELVSGWLLTLAQAQVETVIASGVFAIDAVARTQAEGMGRVVNAALGSRRRCYVEEDGGQFVFHNFRRRPAGAPKRVVL